MKYPIPSHTAGRCFTGSNSDPLIVYNIYHNFQDHVEVAVHTIETFSRTHFIGKVWIFPVCICNPFLIPVLKDEDLLSIRLRFQDLSAKVTLADIRANQNAMVQFTT
jgi:hypothetical protein